MLLLKLRNQLGFNSIKWNRKLSSNIYQNRDNKCKKKSAVSGSKKNDTAIKGVSTNVIFATQCALHVYGSRTKEHLSREDGEGVNLW